MLTTVEPVVSKGAHHTCSPLSPVILKDAHYMLFYLTPAIQPRMLVTFDEELNPLPVTVRVGQVRINRHIFCAAYFTRAHMPSKCFINLHK